MLATHEAEMRVCVCACVPVCVCTVCVCTVFSSPTMLSTAGIKQCCC